MLKPGSKRRRTKAEIKKAQQDELAKENETRSKIARLNQVEAELNEVGAELEHTQHQANVNKGAAILMSDLVQAGIVKESGPGQFIVHGRDGELKFNYDE